MTSVWWDECINRDHKCLHPNSCYSWDKEKGRKLYPTACRTAVMHFIRRYILCVMIMEVAKFIVELILVFFLLRQVHWMELTYDWYLADLLEEELRAKIGRVGPQEPSTPESLAKTQELEAIHFEQEQVRLTLF